MIIKVTKEDIKKGLKRVASLCPIALAIAKKGHKASVSYTLCYINHKPYNLCEDAVKFIENYDFNKKIVEKNYYFRLKNCFLY